MQLPSGLPTAEAIAEQSARILLEIKAVSFNSREPFTWTSGRKAPTYVDCRKVISFPRYPREPFINRANASTAT